MSYCLGLSVGESFAELVSMEADKLTSLPGPSRWLLSRRGLTDGLRDALSQIIADGGHLRVTTSLPSHTLSRRLGTTPAFLTTTGLEAWLGLQAPRTPTPPSFRPQRGWTPIPEDHIFGIQERIRSDGEVEVPLSLEELEFLITKLELLKTKTIAVGLLHSGANPAHEHRIREFLQERGFTVFCSSDCISDMGRENPRALKERSEGQRWQSAVDAAYVWTALQEQKQEIENAFGPHLDRWSIQYATTMPRSLQPEPGIGATWGGRRALAEWARRLSGRTQPLLHLGLENFFLVRPPRPKPRNVSDLTQRTPVFAHEESAAAETETIQARTKLLSVQPTSVIEPSLWAVPTLGETTKGYEPGPMMFGKSLRPLVIDLLYVLEQLKPVTGLSPLINERSKSRILDALYTMSKDIPMATRIDPAVLAQTLQTVVIDRIEQELAASRIEGELLLSGALAESFFPLLRMRRPDLRLKPVENAEWAEALSLAALEPEN